VAPCPAEGAGEAGQVAWRRGPPAIAVGVLAIDVDEEAGKRPNVFVVVPDDVDQPARFTVAQEREVALRDLPAGNVGVPTHAQERRLDRREAGIDHSMPEQSPNDRQQIEVARMGRRSSPGQPIPGRDQRPVEALAVVGDQPTVARDMTRQLAEERRFVGVIGQEQLDLSEAAAFPPA
jgi:hypothetical protein